MTDKPWYLAGPMTGIPQFNFPEFQRVTNMLRQAGYPIRSPAELDDQETYDAAMASVDGAPGSGVTNGETWGDFLSRDVKLVADESCGVIVMPGWERSRGARLEVFVAELCSLPVRRFVEGEDGDWGLAEIEGDQESVLDEASGLIKGARLKQYGHPAEDFGRTAKMWSGILGVDVEPRMVPLCMIAVKLSRIVESPNKRDSVVDVAGYAGTYELERQRNSDGLV